MSLILEPTDLEMLEGKHGAACQFAMKLLVQYAEMLDAKNLISVVGAHIDGCLYHGQASLDFAQRLVQLGGQVRVPTTLNVSSLDRLHPHLYRGDATIAKQARALMDAYETLGCTATWTCAPYQLPNRPRLGEQIAWAESNAIVFANSVLGARTNRYGDFLDICAAITGRVPDVGLHQTQNRRGQIVFSLEQISSAWQADSVLCTLLGFIVGKTTGSSIPVLLGLPSHTSEDDLKGFGATAASSGRVAMFHAVGITPEARTLEMALQNQAPEQTILLTDSDLQEALNQLNTLAVGAKLTAISLGTPHFSLAEFARLMPFITGLQCHPDLEFLISTNRSTLAQLEDNGWLLELNRFGVQIVVDTCTYITPILRQAGGGAVMTNSGKWAHYAPANLGVTVAFGSLRDCVQSAVKGSVWRE
jgi:predicted aconitase